MDWIKGIGYVFAALLVIAVVLIGGALISVITAAAGSILVAVAVVAFVALCIKEYCEPTQQYPQAGKETQPKDSL